MTIKKELLGLIDAVDEPNELTQQSYEDAKRGNTKGPIDTSSVDAMRSATLKSVRKCCPSAFLGFTPAICYFFDVFIMQN